MADVANISDYTYLDRLVKQLDDAAFQSAFNQVASQDASQLIELKLGAKVAYERWAAALAFPANVFSASNQPPYDGTLQVFEQWQAYIIAAEGTRKIELRDVLLATVTGLASRRQVELRHLLNTDTVTRVLDDQSRAHAWPRRVQETVSRALVLAARQGGKADIDSALARVQELSELQRTVEEDWLQSSDRSEESALSLLGLYHAAQATIVVTSYVLTGEYRGVKGRPVNVQTELSVLMSKAFEYAELSADPELMTWIKSVGMIIAKLRADTVWANGFNISQSIDTLIRTISARSGPMYSMLPSQQDALAGNLLDAQREAVVLQMPTSSGKTLMAELSALQAISSYSGAKVVYLTPTRALATQVRRTLGTDFAELGVEVTAASSAFEEDPFEMALLDSVSGVVVSTPEKLDLLLRGRAEWFDQVRLVIVDEAHLLTDGERGARLELLLANIRREHPHVRLLLLTPFVQNAQEVASWLSEERGSDVDVQWRPSRLIVGLAKLTGRGKGRTLEIEWKEPHRSRSEISDTKLVLDENERQTLRAHPNVRTTAITLSKRLRTLGPSLGMFTASRTDAETAALEVAETKAEIDPRTAPPEYRVALALAVSEYGEGSDLATCLSKGVAFHHSALSSELRYLVERLASLGTLDYIAATTTLAQGMNFPVSSVVIHSVTKGMPAMPLTPAEFWNIAGRAGRVGLSEKGVIVFANPSHRAHWERYTQYLSERVDSALKDAIGKINETDSVKWTYKIHEGIRPFIQYLGHAVASLGVRQTTSDLDRLVTASLAGRSPQTRAALTRLARKYLSDVASKDQGYMKVADQTGLASFSFDELYASIAGDPVLRNGDAETLRGQVGLKHLVDALAKLPELSLALEKGHGDIDTEAVATVVHRWINGSTVREIADLFTGEEAERVRNAGKYVFGQVSQIVSWGAHAYLRGRDMSSRDEADEEHRMLPAFIQYGVNSPEAVVASIMGVPRHAATGISEVYRRRNGNLTPEGSRQFRAFLQESVVEDWAEAIEGTTVGTYVSADDLRTVWRDAQGLNQRH
ncbi:DEAD/DEAH box helicase [Rhizobium etli]|uniref:DEAD/DEAH box helicase n=1 Tax=Rhizobium etli TaxID=29449 RepID=UPI0003839671|nr:DEAD/DEAH box helicase [Rhizobium etli]AGS25654.1 DEAD/DEAH box type DNA/RNA helicase protein [Rhizobium etli bv. mimosae str. Mim1]